MKTDDALFHLIFGIPSYIATPFHWLETPIIWTLGPRTSTSFRMFPRSDIDPLYPKYAYPTSIAYTYALIGIICLPYFLHFDRLETGRSALGRMLHPLTKTAGPVTEVCVMFARVWLAATWINAATAQLLGDYCVWAFSLNTSCLFFIL